MKKKLKWYSFRLRVVFVVLVIIAAWGGCVGYRYYLILKLPSSMGTGPAGPAVDAEPFVQVWSEKEAVLVGIGDSITKGFGTVAQYSYFNLLIENDDRMYPDMADKDLSSVLPNLASINRSQNYTVTQEHLDNQLPRVPVFGDDVKGIIVVTSGGNDLIHDYGRTPPRDGAIYGCSYEQAIEWTENIKQRIRDLLEGLAAKFPGGCEIFLANIYDPTDGVSDPQTIGMARWPDGTRVLALMNQKIKELCDEYDNVHLVDIHSEFLGHGIHCLEFWRRNYRKDDPHFWYYDNLEDPNTRGYDAVRRLFLIEMVKVLPEKLN